MQGSTNLERLHVRIIRTYVRYIHSLARVKHYVLPERTDSRTTSSKVAVFLSLPISIVPGGSFFVSLFCREVPLLLLLLLLYIAAARRADEQRRKESNMPITLVGSSRELKHKRFLPNTDLLDLVAGGVTSGAVAAAPGRPESGAREVRTPLRIV